MEAKKWKKTAQIPEETARAVECMADRLEDMDKAEGVFGEALTDEDLDAVAGGEKIKIIAVPGGSRVIIEKPRSGMDVSIRVNITPPPGY